MVKKKVRTAWIAEVRRTCREKFGIFLTDRQSEELILNNDALHKEFVYYGQLDDTGQEVLAEALLLKHK